jgi:hypothetical protein
MEIIKYYKASLLLIENTPVFCEFGRMLKGEILGKKVIEIPRYVREFYDGQKEASVIVVETEHGDRFNIPTASVEHIHYG